MEAYPARFRAAAPSHSPPCPCPLAAHIPLKACHGQAPSRTRARQSDKEARALAAGEERGSNLEDRGEKESASGPPYQTAKPPHFIQSPAPHPDTPAWGSLPASTCPLTACLGHPSSSGGTRPEPAPALRIIRSPLTPEGGAGGIREHSPATRSCPGPPGSSLSLCSCWPGMTTARTEVETRTWRTQEGM